jgi:hypothetical protein
MKYAALFAIIAAMFTAAAVADENPTYTGPESASEKRFVATVQHDLSTRFATAAQAQHAGYVRYTNVDESGAISYANCRWTSNDLLHPSQLWYDRNGKLLGADYSIELPRSQARPNLWGVNPGRWAKLDGHEHWVTKNLSTGALSYEHYVHDEQFAAAGGDPNHPSARTLVAMHRVDKASDVVHLFHFPALWDLTVWVKPNPSGAFADINPTVPH